MESAKSQKILRIFLPLVFLIGININSIGQQKNEFIYLPAHEISNELSESVRDMAYWLSQAIGKQFLIQTGKPQSNAGILLEFVEKSDLKPDIKKKILADGQSFYLSINGIHSVRIIGTGDASLINGIYTFLYELGFRWYMPGDEWTIVPNLKNFNIQIAKIYAPDFQNRSYFGTGGMNAIAALDPQNKFKKDFLLWNRRNRFGGNYAMRGHTGQVFYSDNKKFLSDHPEYFCQHTVNRYGRIDIANPGAIDLYIQWALKQVNPNDRFSVIGVEPADGSGRKDDCLPPNMSEIKTWSDKYFWLANKVAKEVEQKKIGALVELYAYSSHAAPPSFDLEKVVYPVIIPYAFQNIADPKQFIDLWSRKLNGRAMGMYDYWNITQWSSDLPQFNIYSIPEKLKLWKQKNITTVNLESTNAKGPMGPALWITAQMMWNTNLSMNQLYDEFLNKCFGEAASDIKNMYDRWSIHYQGAMEVALSLHDLASAANKTKDQAVQKRITELKAYVHYLKLYYDYQGNLSTANYKQLIDYIYSIHELRLLQTSALVTSYIKKPVGIMTLPNYGNNAITYDEIEANFEKDIMENPVAYHVSDFAFDVTKASPAENKTKKKYNPPYINGTNTYRFYLPSDKNIVIQAGATANTEFIIKDQNNAIVFDKIIIGSKQGYDTIKLKLQAGKYSLTFGAYYRFSRLIFPSDIVFVSSDNNYDNAGYPLQYIYVPKDVTEIIYRDNLGPGVNKRGFWKDPDGEIIQPELLKVNIYRIQVPRAYRGKVWILNIGHRKFELLNIPNVFSLNNFSYSAQ